MALWVALFALPGSVFTGPEVSAQMILSEAFMHGRAFGRAFITSQGPLGWLFSGQVSSGAFSLRLAWELTGRLLLHGLLIAVVWDLSVLRRSLILGVVLALGWLAPESLNLFLAAILLVRWVLPVGTVWWKVLLGLWGLVFLAQVEFSLFLLAGVGLLLVSAGSFVKGQWRRGLFLPFFAILSFVLLWEMIGQNVMRVPAYLGGAMDLFLRRPWGMSREAPLPVLFAGLLVVSLLGLVCLCRLTGRRLVLDTRPEGRGLFLVRDEGGRDGVEARIQALVYLFAFYISWREGFVQGRVAGFFLFALLLANHSAGSYSRARLRWHDAAVLAAFAGLMLSAGSQILKTPAILLDHGQAWSAAVFQRGRVTEEWIRARGRQVDDDALPGMRGLVGGAGVDQLGAEQSVLLNNGFAYCPRPVAQGRWAQSSRLLMLNRDFLRSAKGPGFLLFRWSVSGGRLFTQEDSCLVAELPWLFEAAMEEKGFLLLRRKAAGGVPRDLLGSVVEQRNVEWKEEWLIPAMGGEGLWIRTFIHPSFLGRVKAFLFHPPEAFIVLTEESGVVHRHRLDVKAGAEGFMLQPYIGDARDFVHFLKGGQGRRLRSFHFECAPDEAEYWQVPAAALLRMDVLIKR